MHLSLSLNGKIQNGRHEINKIIIAFSVIEIETWFSHQTTYFLSRNTNDTFGMLKLLY